MNVAKLFLASQPDWMLIDRGNQKQVGKAVGEYAKLSKGGRQETFEVLISGHAAGFIALTFSRPLPAYVIANLIGWLDDPPDTRGVSGARGWFRVPGSDERFALHPDRSNPWRDTLLGYSAGRKIEVYQPELSICESTKQPIFLAEPSIGPEHVKELVRLECLFDTDPSFGNPSFQITHPPDTNWNP